MSVEQLSSVFVGFNQSAEVDLTEVHALQTLIRGAVATEVLDKGRKIWLLDQEPFTQGFCVMQNGSMSARDESVDIFLGVRIQEAGRGEGALSVAFKSLEYGGTSLNNGRKNIYQLRWSGDEARGRMVLRTMMSGKTQTARLPDGRNVADHTHVAAAQKIRPLRRGDVVQAGHRILEVVSTARGRRETPRTIMHRVNYLCDIEDFSPLGVQRFSA